MMDANIYKEKFLEAEEQASELLEELNKLKKEVDHFKEAGKKLDIVDKDIHELVPRIDHSVYELNNLIESLKDIGTEEIISAVEKKYVDIETLIIAQNENNNEIIKKYQNYFFIVIVLSIMTNILVIIFKG
jgi:predicted nuclease with TOPRIM domain